MLVDGDAPFDAKVVECVVDVARLEMRRLAHEAACRHDLIDDELRLIGGETRVPSRRGVLRTMELKSFVREDSFPASRLSFLKMVLKFSRLGAPTSIL